MKKYIQTAGVSIIALLAIFSLSAATASAQTPVTCPEGYTCGPVTPEPCYVFNLNLQIGSRGNDVDALVAFLIKKGFIQNPSNEPVFGEDYNQEVANAVSAYQTSVGVPATGFVGPLTRAAMNADCGPVVPTTPSITVLSPNGGETWQKGTSQTVKWLSTGIDSSEGFTIWLVDENKSTVANLAADQFGTVSNDGYESITVPSVPDGQYYVYVNWTKVGVPAVADFSDTPLTISATSTPVSNASAKVTSSSLDLTYSGFSNEALLTGTYMIEVSGGSQGIYVYKIGGGHQFVDSKGTATQANSQASLGLTPVSSAVATKVDQFGQTLYVIPAGAVIAFKGSHTVDPKHMFAGTYHGNFISVWANPNTLNIDKSLSLNVPANKTNTKIIVGEKSPYISSVNSPVKSGDILTVKGQRLNDVSISIDGITQKNNARISRDATTLTFILPKLANGQHVLVLNNKSTGSSNRAYFDVNGGIQSASSANVTAGTLALNYDQNRNEVGLSAPFAVSVTAGSSDIKFENDSAFGVMYSGKGNPQQNVPVAVQYINKQKAAFPFILKAGQKAEFYMIATANPLTMFAGSYSLSMNGIYVSKNNGAEKESVTFNSNNTNSVVIIGEKSPYINFITNPIKVGEKMILEGFRLNASDTVYVDGAVLKGIAPDTSKDFKTFWFVLPSMSNGQHIISVYNKVNGASNSKQFEVVNSNQSQITFISPKAGETLIAGKTYGITWGGNWSGNEVFNMREHVKDVGNDLLMAGITQEQAGCPGVGKGVCGISWTPRYVTSNYQIEISDARTPKNNSFTGWFTIKEENEKPPTSGTINVITRIAGRTLSSSEANGCVATVVSPNGNGNTAGCVRTLTNQTTGTYQVQWLSGYPSGADTTKKPTISPSYPQTLGERPAGVNPVTFYIDFQAVPVAAPTATFTIEGQKSYTYNPGMTNHYKWSSTNADTFSSSYTATGGTVCGGGPWVANTASGTSDTYMDTRYLGCTWTVTYTAKNSVTGKSASDTVTVKLVAAQSNATLAVSTDSSSPEAGIVIIDEVSNTNGVALLVGKIKAGASDVVLQALPITLSTIGANVDGITGSLKLRMDGDEFTKIVSSGSNSAVVTFNDLDLTINAGSTMTFTVSADINDIEPGSFNEGSSITASLTSANRDNIVAKNSSNQVLPNSNKSGTASGQAQEFRTNGIALTLVSTDTDATTGTSANDDVGLFAITYRVTAVGDTVYVSSLANPVGLTYAVEKGGSVISSNNISASIVNSTDTTLTSSGNYEIEEGESETFTLYVSVPLGSGNTSGQYRMSLTGVKWDSVDRSALSKTYSSGLEQFRTNYQVLNAVPNPRKTASVLDALGGFFSKLYGFDGN